MGLLGKVDARTARTLAVASGLFCIVLIASMAWVALVNRPIEHFDQEELLALRERLLTDPDNAGLQERARDIDLQLRQDYFESRAKLHAGAYLLLFGGVVFILSMRRLAVVTRECPKPVDLRRDDGGSRMGLSFLCLCLIFGLGLGGSLMVHRLRMPAQQPETAIDTEESTVIDIAEIPQTPLVKRWSQIRGNAANGICDTTVLPDTWNGESGENILWRVHLPKEGKSSPVIWEDKVFLTGWDENGRSVSCFSLLDGALLWSCDVRTEAASVEFEAMGETGLAAPTVTTDGRGVYAYFGSNELVAVDYDGKQLWGRWFGEPKSMYGLASSPIMFDEKIYLQLDQGDIEDGLSRLYCIEPADGRTVWSMSRDVKNSWSSPIGVKSGDREMIVTASDPWVIAYDPRSGREWWRAEVLSGDVAPMPCFGNDLVFTTTEYSQLAAIRTDGNGNVSDTHVMWTYDEELPDVASPVTDGEFILVPTAYGTVNCLNANTGEAVWTEDYDLGFWSSPILSGDVCYLTDMDGVTHIFKYRNVYELIRDCPLGEPVVTTPAFVENRIVFRTEENLICVGQ